MHKDDNCAENKSNYSEMFLEISVKNKETVTTISIAIVIYTVVQKMIGQTSKVESVHQNKQFL